MYDATLKIGKVITNYKYKLIYTRSLTTIVPKIEVMPFNLKFVKNHKVLLKKDLYYQDYTNNYLTSIY